MFPNLVVLIQPFLAKALELITWFLTSLWDGFKDMMDNANAVLFVFVVAGLAYVWADNKADTACYAEKAKIHNEYAKKLKQPVRTVPSQPSFDIWGVFR